MITSIINDLVSTWEETPYDINCGRCEDFALSLIDRMGGDSDSLYDLCTLNFDPEMITNLPAHVWIFYKGRHYDAESPKGVDNWNELPIFARARRDPDKLIALLNVR